MKIKTSELTGPALDWAVAIACGWNDVQITAYEDPDTPDEPFFSPSKVVNGVEICGGGCRWKPSTDWFQGGPIIERENISLEYDHDWVYDPAKVDPDDEHDNGDRWLASLPLQGDQSQYGSIPLIAAMRCYVASKLGDEVDVPDELA